ncbi:hypothetical protein B0H12DRAFT_1052861 [Mycena haematopus]|nr:hypothetical protein B0H12DRAFT_1052861 [Mycena haematopus]
MHQSQHALQFDSTAHTPYNMTDPRRYYSQSSGSQNVPHSTYSSLSNAVPMSYQSNSSPNNHGGNQMYAQAPMNHGHSSTQAHQHGYGAPAYNHNQPGHGFDAPSSQYPTTPYTSPGAAYPNTMGHNMQYPSSQQQSYAPPYNTAQHPGNYYGGAPGPYAPGTVPAPDPGTSIKQCSNCGKMSTPLWRRDSITGRTLCNACGLYQQHRHEPRPRALIDADNDDDEEEVPSQMMGNGSQCSHCGTRKTSVWRRNKDGEQVCNACGVYYRVNGRERPLTMPPSKVKPRANHT